MAPELESPGRFRPPAVAAHELVRERLLTRITSHKTLGAAQVTLVQGPPGFGKTTLLAQAYRRAQASGDRAVWLECSELDTEPAHFVDTLYAAGGAAGMRRAEQQFTTADLAARLGGLGARVYLFLDALERLVASDAEMLLERLVALLPENIHVLLGSRQPLNAWFLQLELQGLGATIGAPQLRLTLPELSALLPQRFTSGELARVEEITEGWPVAVQMTRLRATEAVSIAETLEWLAHEGLGLFDYLAERVLESLSPAQRLFLRDTSVLPTVSVVAANALLHADDGFALMSAVLRLQPIVTITGDREFTIRLHPLLRQYMRNELARQGREHECELQRRAAEVLAAGGEVLGGVQHALLAADLSLAVRLFERAGGEALIFALGARRVLSLAAALPGAARAASPALRLVDVLMAAVEGRAGVTRRLRADLVHDLEATAPLPDPAWREYAVGLSDAAVTLLADPYEGIGAHDFAKLAATERLARLDFARDETKLGLILALQVLIYARHARVAEARRTLEDYVALVERNGFGPQHPSVNPQRGLLAWLEGDIDLSLASLSRNPPQRIERFAEPEPLLAQLSTVLVASMHYERDELDKAHELLDRLSVDPDRTFPETWALGARLRALTLVALGRVRQADHGLAEERERAGRRGAVRLGLMVEATRLELALRSGPDFAPVPAPDSAIVERLAAALAAEIARPDSSWLFAASLAPGVVLGLLALSQAERARALAGRWTQRSSERGHGPLEARGRLLAARAAEALDDVTGALAEILAALPLTAPGHLVRPYLDLLGRSPAMLLRVLGHLTDLKTIEHLRLVMRSCEALASSPSGWALLSERERDVLWALSAHASTKVIAKNLGVSPETVKHHLKRIFAKLGVHTREEALKRIAHLAG